MQKTTIAPPAADERAVDSFDNDDAPLTLNERLLIGLSQSSRYIALLAACIATCGSLFMSEVLHWQPCVLCWYQRILMYPLSLLIAVGILRRDRGLHLYILPLSLFGACVSIYHYAVTKGLIPPPACDAITGISCVTGWLNWFGFINVPFLALIAFIIISMMMMVSATIVVDEGDEEAAATASVRNLVPAMPVVAILVGVIGTFFVAALLR